MFKLCSSTERKELASYFYNNKNNDSRVIGISPANGNVIKSPLGIMIEKEIHACKLDIVKWLIPEAAVTL